MLYYLYGDSPKCYVTSLATLLSARLHCRPTAGRYLQRASVVWPASMDQIGQKERAGTPTYRSDGTCFASTSSPPKQFTIHPDWVSENLTVAKLNLKERTGSIPRCNTTRGRAAGITGYHVRRCSSAPPSRVRNPITWEYS